MSVLLFFPTNAGGQISPEAVSSYLAAVMGDAPSAFYHLGEVPPAAAGARWSPPQQASPTASVVPPGATAYAPTFGFLEDVDHVMPDTARTAPIVVQGGRHHRFISGQINLGAGNTYAIDVQDASGSIFIEGVEINLSATQHPLNVGGSTNFDPPYAAQPDLYVQNSRFVGGSSIMNLATRALRRVYIHNVTGTAANDGIIMTPGRGIKRAFLSRIDLAPAGATNVILLRVLNVDGLSDPNLDGRDLVPYPIDISEVYLARVVGGGGSLTTNWTWPPGTIGGQPARANGWNVGLLVDASNNGEWPSPIQVNGSIRLGPPSAGQYVPAGVAGLTYPLPGEVGHQGYSSINVDSLIGPDGTYEGNLGNHGFGVVNTESRKKNHMFGQFVLPPSAPNVEVTSPGLLAGSPERLGSSTVDTRGSAGFSPEHDAQVRVSINRQSDDVEIDFQLVDVVQSGVDAGTWQATFTSIPDGDLYAKATQGWTEGTAQSNEANFIVDAIPISNPLFRPYLSSAPWNKPLPLDASGRPTPALHASSAQIITRINSWTGAYPLGVAQADTPSDWNHPVFFAKSTDPQFTVAQATGGNGSDYYGTLIRIPQYARPARGGDGHLCVIQPDGTEWDLYDVTSDLAGTIRLINLPVGGGTIYAAGFVQTPNYLTSLGLNTGSISNNTGSANAARIGLIAGPFRGEEMANDKINHALWWTIKGHGNNFVYPATHSGGTGGADAAGPGVAPPMGARFFLDMTIAEIEALAIPRYRKTIAHAMREYGAIAGDAGGSPIDLQPLSGTTYSARNQRDPLVEYFSDIGNDVDWRTGVDYAGRLRVAAESVSLGTTGNIIDVAPGAGAPAALTSAYNAAASGDIIRLSAGDYGAWTTPTGTKNITIQGVGDASRFTVLTCNLANATFRNFRARCISDSSQFGGAQTGAWHDTLWEDIIIDGENRTSPATLDPPHIVSGATVGEYGVMLHGNYLLARNTFRRVEIRNGINCKGIQHGGLNHLFEDCYIHDIQLDNTGRETSPGDYGIHNEGMYVIASPGLTIRRCTFLRCPTMNVFFTGANDALDPRTKDVTLENNIFGHCRDASNNWHDGPCVYIAHTDNLANGQVQPDGARGPIDNFQIRYNLFEHTFFFGTNRSVINGSKMVGNIGGWSNLSSQGMVYRFNVGDKIHATDTLVSPSESSSSTPIPVGWINPAADNFQLGPTSVALGKGDPVDFPTIDRIGAPRVSPPDAGPLERP